MTRDYYAELGVTANAEEEDIENAYKKQARKYHPDRNLEDTLKYTSIFQDIGNAFEVLKDPVKRARYDAERKIFVAKHKTRSEQRNQDDHASKDSRSFPSTPHDRSTKTPHGTSRRTGGWGGAKNGKDYSNNPNGAPFGSRKSTNMRSPRKGFNPGVWGTDEGPARSAYRSRWETPVAPFPVATSCLPVKRRTPYSLRTGERTSVCGEEVRKSANVANATTPLQTALSHNGEESLPTPPASPPSEKQGFPSSVRPQFHKKNSAEWAKILSNTWPRTTSQRPSPKRPTGPSVTFDSREQSRKMYQASVKDGSDSDPDATTARTVNPSAPKPNQTASGSDAISKVKDRKTKNTDKPSAHDKSVREWQEYSPYVKELLKSISKIAKGDKSTFVEQCNKCDIYRALDDAIDFGADGQRDLHKICGLSFKELKLQLIEGLIRNGSSRIDEPTSSEDGLEALWKLIEPGKDVRHLKKADFWALNERLPEIIPNLRDANQLPPTQNVQLLLWNVWNLAFEALKDEDVSAHKDRYISEASVLEYRKRKIVLGARKAGFVQMFYRRGKTPGLCESASVLHTICTGGERTVNAQRAALAGGENEARLEPNLTLFYKGLKDMETKKVKAKAHLHSVQKMRSKAGNDVRDILEQIAQHLCTGPKPTSSNDIGTQGMYSVVESLLNEVARKALPYTIPWFDPIQVTIASSLTIVEHLKWNSVNDITIDEVQKVLWALKRPKSSI